MKELAPPAWLDYKNVNRFCLREVVTSEKRKKVFSGFNFIYGISLFRDHLEPCDRLCY